MEPLVNLKNVCDDFEVEFEVLPSIDLDEITDERRKRIAESLQSIDSQLQITKEKIDELNADIDRLTNHADGLDYAIAVISGVITGMIDSFLVGETDIDKKNIQATLEKKYHTANDSAYKHKDEDGHSISSPMYHRLDDLAHHPTLAGLVASILVRYFRLVILIDGSDGKPHIFFADTSSSDVQAKEMKQLQMAWVGAVVGGICLWLASVAEKKYKEETNEEMPEPLKKIVKAIGATPLMIELLKAADTWIGHMMSDVSTSQGIPGVFLSFMKEISVLPGFRNTGLPGIVAGLYNKGNMNLSEWGGVVFTAAKKQAMPVLINEVLVRGFYFVRHLVSEYRECGDWRKLDWNKTIPFGNRTIVRMITISSGTFVAIDLADAAIRSAANPSSVSVPTFLANMVLRVNFVGLGRFAVSVGTDVGMGIKRRKLRKERIKLYNEQISLTNVKIYYKQADMWITAENTGKTIDEAYDIMKKAAEFYCKSLSEIGQDMKEIESYIPEIEEKNPGLLDEINDILTWEE